MAARKQELDLSKRMCSMLVCHSLKIVFFDQILITSVSFLLSSHLIEAKYQCTRVQIRNLCEIFYHLLP